MDDLLLRELKVLDEIEGRAKKDLERGPEGKLSLSRSNGRAQFYLRADCGKKRYISANQEKLVRGLAQKEYARTIVDEIHRRRQVVSRDTRWRERAGVESWEESGDMTPLGFRSLDSGGPKVVLKDGLRDLASGQRLDLRYLKGVYDRLPQARKDLVEPYLCPDDERIKRWTLEEPAEQRLPGDSRIYQAECGIMVRSKSEMIIADRLNRAGVLFRYEQPMLLGETMVHPDFLILRRGTFQEVVWEHFGLMEDAEYAMRALKKLALYSAAGLVPGVGLVVTFESSNSPLDVSAVDRTIALLV